LQLVEKGEVFMSKYVNVASVQFSTRANRYTKPAYRTILKETRQTLASLQGYGLDLVVTSEGVEGGQMTKDAEDAARPGPYLEMYREFAAKARCHVAASVKLREGRNRYNSIAFLGPDGSVLGVYHKTNLTDGERDMGLSCGPGAVVVDTAIGRLGGAVCFDLNFEWLRIEYRKLKPDILCFASMYHGGLMQGIWAYECRSFFVSALPFMGCGILDPFGRPVRLTDNYTKIARARINLDRVMVHLDFNREKFPAIERKYGDEVFIDIPPQIAPALIYSMTDKRTAMDIVREFDLELMDDYMDRSIRANAENRAAARRQRPVRSAKPKRSNKK
jgi:hypothetical protein